MTRRFALVSAYLHTNVQVPQRKTELSAGYDIQASADVTLVPYQVTLIPTGLKALMAKDEVLLLAIRSSLALKKQVMLANGVGVIDADYVDNPDNEGHIQVALLNLSAQEVLIQKGQAVAQGIFTRFLTTDDDNPGGQRHGGFGSTDQQV